METLNKIFYSGLTEECFVGEIHLYKLYMEYQEGIFQMLSCILVS